MLTTAWRMPQRSWTGPSSLTSGMVEQFGLAMTPLTGRVPSTWALTWGTTSGVSGSIRKALVLSMTRVPWATALGTKVVLTRAPAEKKATSAWEKSKPSRSCTW